MPKAAATKVLSALADTEASALLEDLEQPKMRGMDARTKVMVPHPKTFRRTPVTPEKFGKLLLEMASQAIIERNRELDGQKTKHRVHASYAFADNVHTIVFEREELPKQRRTIGDFFSSLWASLRRRREKP
jgi:hypothetical protein